MQPEHLNICNNIKPATTDSRCPLCSRFKYFIWLNSSGRGPFLPPYYAEISQGASWTRAFTAKLTDKVKLVGSSISCGGAYTYPPTPHVQTYAVATDRQGLEVLLAKVRECLHSEPIAS